MFSLRENQWKNIYRRLLYTKYKAENNALCEIWSENVPRGLGFWCRIPVLGRVGSL